MILPAIQHSWNLSSEEAIKIQSALREKVQLKKLSMPPLLIGGADVSFNKFSTTLYAGIVVLRLADLMVVEKVAVRTTVDFPYIPGLLSFREIPPLMQAWEKLQVKPDVMVLDGQGIAHPRKLGIASHFGLLTGIPSIGCAKSLLTGKYEEPGAKPGDSNPLIDKGEEIGRVLRTKFKVNPVFVSPGHLITSEDSISILLSCLKGYRIPEPTRLAHRLVNQARTGEIPV